jgi:Peptidase A4 family
MFSLFSKKLVMAVIITVALPVAASAAAVSSGASSNLSYNWAGYQATGGTFTGVNGTWTVPSVSSANTTEADATWVGIGGVESHDLIQAGTQALINGSGAPAYQAWYEILPNTTQQVPLAVSPGDSMSVSIAETATGSGEWNVSIRDNTTGQSYQTSLAYNSSQSSAEWIEEMPSDGSSFVPIDNFGTISFTGGTAIENGNTVSMTGAGAAELTMVNGAQQTLAMPSLIGSDGESFTVTRSSASPSVAASGGYGNSGSGTGYVVIGGGGGLGRGWHRTGVGIEGYRPHGGAATSTAPTQPMPASVTTVVTGTGATWQSFYQLMQQLRELQQQAQLQLQAQAQTQMQNFRGGFIRDGGRIGTRIGR